MDVSLNADVDNDAVDTNVLSSGSDNDETTTAPKPPTEQVQRFIDDWAAIEKLCVRSRDGDDDVYYEYEHYPCGDPRAAVGKARQVRQRMRAIRALGECIVKDVPIIRNLLHGLLATRGRRIYLATLFQEVRSCTLKLADGPGKLQALLAAHPWLATHVKPFTWSDDVYDVRDAVQVRVQAMDKEGDGLTSRDTAAAYSAWCAWLAEQPARGRGCAARKHNIVIVSGCTATMLDRLLDIWEQWPEVPAQPPQGWLTSLQKEELVTVVKRKAKTAGEEKKDMAQGADAVVTFVRRCVERCARLAERVCVCSLSSRSSTFHLKDLPTEALFVTTLLPRLAQLENDAVQMLTWARNSRRQLDSTVETALQLSGQEILFQKALAVWQKAGGVTADDTEWTRERVMKANAKVAAEYAALVIPRLLSLGLDPLTGGQVGVNTTIRVWDPRPTVMRAAGALPEPQADDVAVYEATLHAALERVRTVVTTVRATMDSLGIAPATETDVDNVACRIENVATNSYFKFSGEIPVDLASVRAAVIAGLPAGTVEAHTQQLYRKYRRSTFKWFGGAGADADGTGTGTRSSVGSDAAGSDFESESDSE